MFSQTQFHAWLAKYPTWEHSPTTKNLDVLEVYLLHHPDADINTWDEYVRASREMFTWVKRDTRGIPFNELTQDERAEVETRFRKGAAETRGGNDKQALRESQEQAAREAEQKKLSNPIFIAQAQREADNVVSIYRGHSHSETARHRQVLSETIVTKPGSDEIDWFATLDARKAKATELYDGKVLQ